jgi:N-acetylmuramoyl-L-alanine amidase
MRNYVITGLLLMSAYVLEAQHRAMDMMVQTRGDLAFLEYGPGDDRLGGAKMSYIDSNVVLKVVDSLGSDYIVQLSKFHSAFIAKESVQPAVSLVTKPYYLTGNWKVYGDSSYDYVMISLDEKLPYRSQQFLTPSRICIDIFGAKSNTNWITQLKTAKEIRNVYYEQVEEDVFRATIELRHNQHWGHSIQYDSAGKRLVVKVKRQPPSADIRKLRIAIDAGHGGDNAGATGVKSKLTEKQLTLLMAKELQATLKRAGVKEIFMTRTNDTTLSMPERINMLKEFDPHLLISIHLNSSSSDTVRGTSTYYRYIGFRPLTKTILDRMLSLGLKEFGNIGNFNFSLNGPTDYPNCLVEVAFLSNEKDEKIAVNPKFHKAVAGKIYLGIVDWLNQLK